jgi:hypothetical protein
MTVARYCQAKWTLVLAMEGGEGYEARDTKQCRQLGSLCDSDRRYLFLCHLGSPLTE